MSFTLCTSGAIVMHAGSGVSSTASTSAAILEEFSNEAEMYINAATRYDWITNYSSVTANYKGVLATAAAARAAKNLVKYDMSGYTSVAEAESVININHDETEKAIDLIKEKQNQEKMI